MGFLLCRVKENFFSFRVLFRGPPSPTPLSLPGTARLKGTFSETGPSRPQGRGSGKGGRGRAGHVAGPGGEPRVGGAGSSPRRSLGPHGPAF